MEIDMLIRSDLSDAKWLIAKGGTDRQEVVDDSDKIKGGHR